MNKQCQGKAFVFGNNIDTDQIYPGRFVQYTDVEEVKQYAMHGADKDFVHKIKPGDLIIAGINFGCGSSREHAAITLKAVGVSAIIAESFGRIFYRNAINLGIPLIICKGISSKIETGDLIDLDLTSGQISCEGQALAVGDALSDYVMTILEHGGIKPLIKKQLLGEKA